jgi:hypothetical protein
VVANAGISGRGVSRQADGLVGSWSTSNSRHPPGRKGAGRPGGRPAQLS